MVKNPPANAGDIRGLSSICGLEVYWKGVYCVLNFDHYLFSDITKVLINNKSLVNIF